MLLDRRDSTSHDMIQILSEKIFWRLKKIKQFSDAKSVGCYYSIGSEVQTLSIIHDLINSGKNISLPKVNDDAMKFRIIKDFEKNQIKKESFSIAKKSDYSYTINIPNRAYQIAELNNILINEFKLNISLKIPQSLDDWNQDLKNTKNQESKEATLKKNTNIKI